MTGVNDIDGIYSVYLTGSSGVSLGLFYFKEGIIAGADIAGMLYDGTFEITPDGYVVGNVKYVVPLGHSMITGFTASNEPIELTSPLKLPIDFTGDHVHRIETPSGPVNAKFKKVRAL